MNLTSDLWFLSNRTQVINVNAYLPPHLKRAGINDMGCGCALWTFAPFDNAN
jgi:hypothetical protein